MPIIHANYIGHSFLHLLLYIISGVGYCGASQWINCPTRVCRHIFAHLNIEYYIVSYIFVLGVKMFGKKNIRILFIGMDTI